MFSLFSFLGWPPRHISYLRHMEIADVKKNQNLPWVRFGSGHSVSLCLYPKQKKPVAIYIPVRTLTINKGNDRGYN